MSYIYIPPTCGGHSGISLDKKRELFRITLDEFKANTDFMNGEDFYLFEYDNLGFTFTPKKRYVVEFLEQIRPITIVQDNYGHSAIAKLEIEISYWWGLSFIIYNPSRESLSDIVTTDLIVYEFELSEEINSNCLPTNMFIGNSISSSSRMGEIGNFSTAFGGFTEASGFCSHAEGFTTKATGNHSHAEGRETTASGNDSHSEGYGNVASGEISHVEGSGNTASNDYAHAEGNFNKANGVSSHVEGSRNIANGMNSHAEGYYTKASSENQHVQGRFNIEDTAKRYADIVGNGKAGKWDASAGVYNHIYSNAYTLDWYGNGWFAKDVFVGGTSQDDGKKLATEEFVNSIISFDSDGNLVITINGVSKKFAPIE